MMTPRELKDRSSWYVLLEWPNGRSRQIDGFRSEAEAETWIKEESEIWLKKSDPEHRDDVPGLDELRERDGITGAGETLGCHEGYNTSVHTPPDSRTS